MAFPITGSRTACSNRRSPYCRRRHQRRVDGHDGDGVLGPRAVPFGADLILKGELRRLCDIIPKLRRERASSRGRSRFRSPDSAAPAVQAADLRCNRVTQYFCEPSVRKITGDDIHRWSWPADRWRVRQLQPLLPRALIGFEQKEIEAACYGIDLRHPFADRDFVEFLDLAACVPSRVIPDAQSTCSSRR